MGRFNSRQQDFYFKHLQTVRRSNMSNFGRDLENWKGYLKGKKVNRTTNSSPKRARATPRITCKLALSIKYQLQKLILNLPKIHKNLKFLQN